MALIAVTLFGLVGASALINGQPAKFRRWFWLLLVTSTAMQAGASLVVPDYYDASILRVVVLCNIVVFLLAFQLMRRAADRKFAFGPLAFLGALSAPLGFIAATPLIIIMMSIECFFDPSCGLRM